MYRILSPTAILGYGFPISSFEKAMELEINLIGVDAGSMDAGPYYLGSGKPYMGAGQLKRDLRVMVRGALFQQCPLIIGSAGFSGSGPPFDQVVSLVKNLLSAEAASGTTIAVIRSEIEPQQLLSVAGDLQALGHMPTLDKSAIWQSRLVGQMGIEPIVSALESGARIIICGRCYDPAIFAADPIRRGYPAGPAYHAAKILECGAIACEPGSGSDCLIAELYRDGRAIFYPTNTQRKATVQSIAAHTLYEKSRPDLFSLPGGQLSIQNTQFYQLDGRTAGFSGSEYRTMPYSLKVEGSRYLGHRVVSIVSLKSAEGLDKNIRIYGRNGVEATFAEAPVEEIGILTVVKSRKQNLVSDALSFLRSTMLHFGYEGRISTAGNLAFPLSPSDVYLPVKNGIYAGFFVAGTRDPVFQRHWEAISSGVMTALSEQHPDLSANCDIEFLLADQERPVAVLESIHENPETAQKLARQAFEKLIAHKDDQGLSFTGIALGDAYGWSVHHLIHDREWIRKLFSVEIESWQSGEWLPVARMQPQYNSGPPGQNLLPLFDEHKNDISRNSLREELPAGSVCTSPLYALAKVIRSKNAGINEITFDLIFYTDIIYKGAIRSGVFSRKNLALIFGIDPASILGSYRYDAVNAIKFTLARPFLSGSPGERDVFGAQQHTRLLYLEIPVDDLVDGDL